jgi:uncharacterized protein DUF6073
MSKSRLLILACAALAVVASVAVSAAPQDDSVRIASLVSEMKSMDFARLESLQPVAVKAYTLPGPSVDVMRVRLEETYTIEGVGKDTVELSGWIAVRHGASRPAPGETLVSWATAVTDTEFVGLELQGDSKVFGPVHVSLDSSRPAIGQVGKINVPERAHQILLAANESTEPAPDTSAVAKDCRAPVNVKVSMSDLGLEMSTKTPAVWYSHVTTIPPVGHVASVTVEPVSLVSADREVGKLVSGTVKFREVVRAVPLSRNHQVVVAP